jgi:hypothetical protein
MGGGTGGGDAFDGATGHRGGSAPSGIVPGGRNGSSS